MAEEGGGGGTSGGGEYCLYSWVREASERQATQQLPLSVLAGSEQLRSTGG